MYRRSHSRRREKSVSGLRSNELPGSEPRAISTREALAYVSNSRKLKGLTTWLLALS